MNDFGGMVEVVEGYGGRAFVRREVVRCKVGQSVDEIGQLLLHSVVGVVGASISSKWKCISELFLVLRQDVNNGSDGRLGC